MNPSVSVSGFIVRCQQSLCRYPEALKYLVGFDELIEISLHVKFEARRNLSTSSRDRLEERDGKQQEADREVSTPFLVNQKRISDRLDHQSTLFSRDR